MEQLNPKVTHGENRCNHHGSGCKSETGTGNGDSNCSVCQTPKMQRVTQEQPRDKTGVAGEQLGLGSNQAGEVSTQRTHSVAQSLGNWQGLGVARQEGSHFRDTTSPRLPQPPICRLLLSSRSAVCTLWASALCPNPRQTVLMGTFGLSEA